MILISINSSSVIYQASDQLSTIYISKIIVIPRSWKSLPNTVIHQNIKHIDNQFCGIYPCQLHCQISPVFIPPDLVIILHPAAGDSTTCNIYQIKLVGDWSPVSPLTDTILWQFLWSRSNSDTRLQSTAGGIDLHRLDRHQQLTVKKVTTLKPSNLVSKPVIQMVVWKEPLLALNPPRYPERVLLILNLNCERFSPTGRPWKDCDWNLVV